MAASTYMLLGVLGVVQVAAPGAPADVAVGAVVMLVGSLVAAPAAWRGWWGVEVPAAGLVMIGVALDVVAVVHDEVVVEVEEGCWERVLGECRRRMEDVGGLLGPLDCGVDVPFVVGARVGSRWGLGDVWCG